MRNDHQAARAAAAVDENRLWATLMQLAEIGATAKGGVRRLAYSAEDIAARKLLIAEARDRGYVVLGDAVGNLFIRRPGRRDDLAPVMTGSHLDSQPTGGRFDGAYGVIAGLEALRALDDAALETLRPIDVVAWANEEGSRFQPGTLGSGAFAGIVDWRAFAGATDSEGTTLADALAACLAAFPDLRRAGFGYPIHAYLEAHIEQGPILEAEAMEVGIVEAVQGLRGFSIDIEGMEAHAGTTPERDRRDAMTAAIGLMGQFRAIAADPEDRLRFTIGRFDLYPNSPNTTPSRVHFSIDMRHPEEVRLDRLSAEIEAIVAGYAGPCRVALAVDHRLPCLTFTPRIVDLIRESAAETGCRHRDIYSGASHDAVNIAKLCPAGMIFVPCRDGISHNEAESATPEHAAAGTRVLAASLIKLANEAA